MSKAARRLLLCTALFVNMPVAAYAAPQDAASGPSGGSSNANSPTSSNALADIVVTAQRRVERIQDVPVAISVVSGAQLDQQQVSQVSDLSKTTASLNFGLAGPSSAGGGGAFIRGIGTAALTRSAESAVGIVVDGVVQGNTNVNNLFDISRVEVLRGPQGTLFGQSVSAGVINITTLAPDPSAISGKITAELSGNGFAGSQFGRQVLRGGINLPISATSAIRISGYGSRTTGVLHNAFLDKDDNQKDVGVRARYQGEFGDVKLNIISDYNYTVVKDGAFFTLISTKPDFPGPTYIPVLAGCGVTPRRGNFDHCASFPERQRARTYGFSGQLDVPVGSLSLTSITAFRRNEILTSQDVDRTPVSLKPFLNIDFKGPTNYQQFTQELRLSSDPANPLTYTIGAFYFDSQTKDDSGPQTGTIVTVNVPGVPFPILSSTIATNNATSKNLSAFGEARYKTGALTLFAGARINRAKQRTRSLRQNVSVSPFAGPISAPYTNDNRFSDTNISWRIGAQYSPNRDLMLYGTVSTGYKNAQALPVLFPGGTDANPVVVANRIAQPEKPTAFEIGAKSTLLGGRLIFNIDAFYQTTKNLQAQTFIQQAGQPFPQLLPGNVSKVKSKGIEADALGKIGDHLTLSASATYNVAKYPKDYFDSQNVSLVGEQIAFAPRFAANFSGELTQPVGGDVEGFLALDARYRTKMRLSDGLRSQEFTVDPSRFILGGRIGARVDKGWSVALFANNITGKHVPGTLLPTLPSGRAAYYSTQSKRQVGLQAQLEF